MKNKNRKNNKTIISAENKKGAMCHQDKLSRQRLTADIKKQIKDVNKFHAILLQKTIKCIFEIGEKILQIKETAIYDNWKKFVKDNFAFSYETACRYVRVYEYYKDNPDCLNDKTIHDAYCEVGIKRKHCLPQAPQGRWEMATVEEEMQYDIEQIFNMPCISKARLENYRIEIAAKDGRIWMIDRSGCSMPVAELYATPPQGFPETEYKELFRDVQIALERYFEKIERYEKMGISERIYTEKQ